jgi:hypothetical protein
VADQTASVERACAAPVQTPSDRKEDLFPILKALAEASGVYIALTFVCGWSYLATYYRTFGLNFLELDVSIPVTSTVAVWVLWAFGWRSLFVVGVPLLLLFFVHRFRGPRHIWAISIIVVLLVAVAIVGVVRGSQEAGRDAREDSTNLPYVAFASKRSNPEPSCVDHEIYGSMDCKLLLHSKGIYYFFQPVVGDGVGSLNLYMLSDLDLVGVHVQRGLESNERVK